MESGSIAFSSDSDLTGGNADGNNEIFLYDGSSITQITSSTSGGSGDPSLDGGAIAFASTSDLTGGNADGDSEIFLCDGSSIVQITSATSSTVPSGPLVPSLDDDSIAFHSWEDLTGANPEGNSEIFLATCDLTTVLEIPALDPGGMVVLVGLLFGAGLLVLRRVSA
ncbi:MAG: hypothetical protein R3324_12990 [Halobacteriales archaeon]|nr:hypothetical protein [Halobacteriales archaeon]